MHECDVAYVKSAHARRHARHVRGSSIVAFGLFASGVASATVADGLPLDFASRIRLVAQQGEATLVRAHVTRVADDYLNTMGIRLIRGRSITAEDQAGSPLVTLISKPLADRLFPKLAAAEVIGKRLMFAVEDQAPGVFLDQTKLLETGLVEFHGREGTHAEEVEHRVLGCERKGIRWDRSRFMIRRRGEVGVRSTECRP